jgi:anaerobic magnesium-protoporphyrin IX monomethyl ester cyclase
MKKSICLVSLPSPFLIDEKVFPPLGLLYLAGSLKKQGYRNIMVYDGDIETIPKGFDIYGLGVTTPQFPQAKKALEHIRSYGRAQVMIGGPHASIDPESCLESGFDSVVMQAGEASVPLVADHRCRIIDTPYHGVEHPDRSLIDLRKYHYEVDGRPATSVMTTRGCPYQCGFCCKINKKVIIYPAQFVIDELRMLKDLYGYKAFMFFDDIFILNIQRLKTILDEITPWDVRWRGFVRADIAAKNGLDMAKRMYDSGCREVGMGIETGDSEILRIVNKGEDHDTIKRGIEILKSAGIRVKGFFIVGLPSESPVSIEATRMFIKDTGLDDIDFSLFTPYKKTNIYENKLLFDIHWDKLELEKSWYKGTPGEYTSQVWTSRMTREDLVSARNNLEAEFKQW